MTEMRTETDLFKALSDPTRLRLAILLALHGESCVCDLARALEVADYNVSRHLGVLRSAGLVEAKRKGTWMHYQLASAQSKLQECLWTYFGECLAQHETIKRDTERLRSGTTLPSRCS